MRDTISQQQIDFFQEQGYVLIEGFLDPEELRLWRDTTAEAVEERLASLTKNFMPAHVTGSRLGGRLRAAGRSALRAVLGEKRVPFAFDGAALTNQSRPDLYHSQVYTQCIRLADTHAGMHNLVFDPRLAKAAATLMGADGVRLYSDQALFKGAFGNPTGWHIDDPFWTFSSPQATTMWIALDDATRDNGCMWYIPGSHKTATYEGSGIGENLGDLFKMYPEWRDIAPVAVPAPAGSVVFHTGLTAHGAGANMTNKPRRAFAFSFMPDGAVFNGKRDILPLDYFNSLKVGDVLNDERINPLLWHKNGLPATAASESKKALAAV